MQDRNKAILCFIFILFFIKSFSYSQIKNYDDEVLIPSGNFWMGNNDNSCNCYEIPIHQVFLDSFYIDKYEVTNAQFKKFIDANGYCDSTFWTPIGWRFKLQYNLTKPKFWDDENFGIKHPNKPVVGISWYEAWAYAKWAGKRLPTEAEWERAARYLDNRLFPWGNEEPDESRCNFGYIFGSTLNASTKEVGSYELGKSEEDIYDLAGNVSEWCNDWYDIGYYSKSPKENPQGPEDGKYKVVRGGSWFLYKNYMRVSSRDFALPSSRTKFIGFRCARTP